jgi:hypothetical protein
MPGFNLRQAQLGDARLRDLKPELEQFSNCNEILEIAPHEISGVITSNADRRGGNFVFAASALVQRWSGLFSHSAANAVAQLKS